MIGLSEAMGELVLLFERLEIPYAVMGGLAVRVYGIPRPTYDIDFTVAVEKDNRSGLYRALRGLGHTVPEVYDSGWVDRVAGMPVVKSRLYLQGHGVDIDIFLAESPFQREVLARRRRHELDDMPICFVSPEDLILLKLIAHRPRDIADIGDIRFTQGQLDEEYLRDWAKQLGVLDALERVLSED